MISLLYYFDLKKQQIEFCKSLVITEEDNITIGKLHKYILENLHSLIPYDDGVHDIIQQMKRFNDKQDIFKIYITSFVKRNTMTCTQYGSDTFIFNDNNNNNKPLQIFVFQLNDDHEYLYIPQMMDNMNYLKQIETYYANILHQECYFDIHELICDESSPILLGYKNNCITLQECVQYYKSIKMDPYNGNNNNVNNNNLYDYPSFIRHKVTPGTNALLLCKKIEKELNYVVPLQCIILYCSNKKYRIKWKQNMVDLGIFRFDSRQQSMIKASMDIDIQWNISPISLITIHNDDKQIEMYNIRI